MGMPFSSPGGYADCSWVLGEKRQVIKAVLIVAGRPKSISLSCAEEDTLEDNKEADLELKRLNNI